MQALDFPEIIRNQEPKVNLLNESFFNMQDNKIIKSEPTENDFSEQDFQSDRLISLAKSIEKVMATQKVRSEDRNELHMNQVNSMSS